MDICKKKLEYQTDYKVKVNYGEEDLLDCLLQMVRMKIAEKFA